MNIGLSINKIKELAGGGASGVTPWKEYGSAKGTAQIQLPSKWTEIKIVTCNSSGLACFSSTMTYEEYQNNVSGKNYFTTFEGYNDSNFAKWCCYPKYVYLEDYHYAGDQTTSCTTTLYYKEVLENVVNVGTESNWELWGEVTGTTGITLPTDFSEIQIIGTCSKHLDTPISINITKEGLDEYLSNSVTLGKDYLAFTQGNFYYKVTNNILTLYQYMSSTENNSYCKTKVYYKKKCDNVLDVNDMGEWKKLAENVSNIDPSTVPSNYKEVMIELLDGTTVKDSKIFAKPYFDMFIGSNQVLYMYIDGSTTTNDLTYRGSTTKVLETNTTSKKINVYYR